MTKQRSDIFEILVVLDDDRREPEKTERRYLISADATFDELHQQIQDRFGWDNSHLFMFILNGEFLISANWEDNRNNNLYAKDCRLGDYLSVGQEFEYIYDMKYEWKHHITVTNLFENIG